ncbi:MAG TPA: nuclear transport factor 2 family protein [Solirubrobacteraceae bacterium]|nr:nuclear transport factor 2 family protein [Solirubrobacteraceae bacterium]
MSQENVEFVEGLLAGTGSVDKQALLAALPDFIAQACAPDIEWVEDPQRADGRVYYGHEGVQQSFERWLEHWDEYGGEPERFIDCSDDVLVIAHEHARGRVSRASVSSRIYMAFTIRAGKIARYREFYDEQAALKAVGLAE